MFVEVKESGLSFVGFLKEREYEAVEERWRSWGCGGVRLRVEGAAAEAIVPESEFCDGRCIYKLGYPKSNER